MIGLFIFYITSNVESVSIQFPKLSEILAIYLSIVTVLLNIGYIIIINFITFFLLFFTWIGLFYSFYSGVKLDYRLMKVASKKYKGPGVDEFKKRIFAWGFFTKAFHSVTDGNRIKDPDE